MNVLILGASRGIGFELVHQHLAAGDRVLATARDDVGLMRLRDLGASAFQLDVTQAASVSKLSGLLEGEKIDRAYYVAGLFAKEGAGLLPDANAFDAMMHTNVLGAMHVIPQVAPRVEAASGQFIFFSSEMGQIGAVSGSYGWLYRTSKAALNMAVVAAQADYPLAQMVLLHPGWVQTDMGTQAATLSAQDSVQGIRKTLQNLVRPAGPLTSQNVPFVRWDGTSFSSW